MQVRWWLGEAARRNRGTGLLHRSLRCKPSLTATLVDAPSQQVCVQHYVIPGAEMAVGRR